MQGALAAVLAFLMLGVPQQQQQQSVPDAPAPQPAGSTDLNNLKNQVTPGSGTGPAAVQAPPSATPAPSQPSQSTSSSSSDAPPKQDNSQQQQAPEIPKPGEGPAFVLRQSVTFVQVPVTVRDSKHRLVSGLTWRQFKLYEDGNRQNISTFIVDPFPISVALSRIFLV